MENAQNVCLFSRGRMELTGIEQVESLTEEGINVSSSLGMIAIEGRKMKIESFSVERGELNITGEFDGFYYYGKKSKDEKKSVLSRLFG